MTKRMLSLLAVLAVSVVLAPDCSAQQCRGGQQGGRGAAQSQTFGGSIQTGGFNQGPQQLAQQAYLQQAALQQLQLQRAVLQQQYALRKAQQREESRQRRLALANAKREKEALRRSQQQTSSSVALLSSNK